MQRRNIAAIIAASVATVVVLCLAVAGIGIATYRYFDGRTQAVYQDIGEALTGQQTPPAQASAAPSLSAPAARASPSPAASRAAAAPKPQSPSAAPAASNPGAASAPLPDSGLEAVAASLAPGNQDVLAAHPDAALYRIDATLDADRRTIQGSQQVRYTNAEDATLSEVYFRIYPNAAHYNSGGIDVAEVRVDGAEASAELSDNDTTLKVALPTPLPPGDAVELAMSFTTTIPEPGEGYGIFGEIDGVFTLYNWHPELAVYEGGSWLLHPVVAQGDPTNTDAANYDVYFTAPAGWSVVSSGVSAGEPTGGATVTHRSTAALARNFVVVASERFERVERQSGDVLVRSFYLPGDTWGGEAALDVTVTSLELFGQTFGPYPYRELDVVEVDLDGIAVGMESSGLIMISSGYYTPEGANPFGAAAESLAAGEGGDALAFTTAHEVAHQWWYGVVGSDAYAQPWLDESLTNWSSAYWVDQTYGPDAGRFARDLFIGGGYRALLATGGDRRLDQPVDAFSAGDYTPIVYGKGPLMYDVLREELGDATFFAFLQRWYREQAFDRGSNQEWLATLNAVAERDMTPFYEKWVEGSAITDADLPPIK